jgi:hypothetical protein
LRLPCITTAVLGNLLPRIEDPILILEALSISISLDSSICNTIASQLQQKFQQRLDLLSEVEALKLEVEALKLAEDLLSSKNYDDCAQTLVTIIPFLSSNSLLKALEIARSINSNEANNSRIDSLTVLNHNILENHFNASDNNSLYADWHRDLEEWKRWVASKFQYNLSWIESSYSEWMQMEGYFERIHSEDIYATNLAVWRAIGNEAIDKRFCQTSRSRAKVLALLFYYFEGKQQTQIFEELLETIEEIPSKSCKARSYIALILHLPYPNAIKIIKRALSVVKEIYEDIINLDLRDSGVKSNQYFDPQDQYREQHIYTRIQNSYTEIQRLESQLHDLTISKLRKEIFWLIETTDYFLFPYPEWWKPNMIEGLPIALAEFRYADFTFYSDDCSKIVLNGQTLKCGQWYQLEVAVRVDPTGVPSQSSERHPILEPKQQEPVSRIFCDLQSVF